MKMQELKDFIQEELLDKTGRLSSSRSEGWVKTHHPAFLLSVKDATDFMPVDTKFGVRINLILNDITELPTCLTCGKGMIPKRGQSQYIPRFCSNPCAQLHESTREKIINTNMERYGVDCHLRQEVKEKHLKKRYGVINPSQLDWVQDKKKKNSIEKYGVLYQQKHLNLDKIHLLSDVEYLSSTNKIDIMQETGISQSHLSKILLRLGITDGIKSHPEESVADYVASIYNGEIIRNSRSIIAPNELDIYIPEYKLAIELHGLFWHAEQKKGKWYHRDKLLQCEECGIKLLQIYENEWADVNTSKVWKSIISHHINQSNVIYARKTEIRKPSKKEERLFLDQNHLQGFVGSRCAYGLYYENQLVALMSFGKPRFNKAYDWELLRYCCALNTTVVGGASKVFKHFVSNNTGSVITYADRRYSDGGLYRALGFDEKAPSPPCSQYIINWKETRNRMQFQKHKLVKILDDFDPKLTAYQNCLNNGYDRIWDAGNRVFELTTKDL
jgi:hypothetical protein